MADDAMTALGEALGLRLKRTGAACECRNQTEVDEQVPGMHELDVPFRELRLIGMEGPVDLTRLTVPRVYGTYLLDALTGLGRTHRGEPFSEDEGHLNRVTISGGDTPLHPAWIRSIRDQCQAAGVEFVFESWGEFGPCELYPIGSGPLSVITSAGRHLTGKGVLDDPDDAGAEIIARVGRDKTGRMLDGREWLASDQTVNQAVPDQTA
ncbi:MAG: DUF5131 family protein [Candidatus Aquicultor sp.]